MGARDFRNAGTTKTLGQNASTPQDQGKDWFTRQYFIFRNGEVTPLPVSSSLSVGYMRKHEKGKERGGDSTDECVRDDVKRALRVK